MNPYAFTAQQIFDRVWHHFLVEKQPFSYDPATGGCYYRGADGARCAVGLFIPDSVYKEEMEQPFCDLVCSSDAPGRLRAFLAKHEDLFMKLQEAHDSAPGYGSAAARRAAFRSDLRRIAKRFGLQVPRPQRRAS